MAKEKDRSDMIIEKLREMIVEGPGAPLSSGKVIVPREEALELLDHLQDTVREELHIYREVNDRRAKLLSEAKEEADRILYEAERGASRIRVTKRREDEPLSFSLEDMDREERETLRTANDIYAASLIYTDEMLTEVDHLMEDAVKRIEEEYASMRATLYEKRKAISDNKSELIRSLNELTQNDRYAQLLELSDLLSVELYREKQKQRAKVKEQEGQLEIQFDQERTVLPEAEDGGAEEKNRSASAEAGAGRREPGEQGARETEPNRVRRTAPGGKDTGTVPAGVNAVRQPRPAINPDRTGKKIEVETHAKKEAGTRGSKTVRKKD